ncbi:TetR/AcrR family transcriptional regulator [Paenibacillus alvei]|uniref:TetR/AcrR family transcriptional regulator n=1 Tax=Paenibacillus alvei TaxID=44250 RepID=A0ABT4ECD3_PAEAL|nr:TetR/AcrR family transcriptional regulator [Paenibacillus alvei]MCY9531405.1 TetR/AcrR family transcriptional regulator [Paenibacillus alvei]
MQDRIAAAAIEEIKARGLKFAIRDVASRLGISTKTLYQHFDSKEQIITYLIEQSIQEMKDTEAQMMNDESLSVVQKVEQALMTLPSAFAFTDIRTLDELKKFYPDQWKLVDAYVQEGWDNIRLLIHQGVQEQHIRPFDMDLFIQMYVGALYQLMDRRANEGSRMSLEEALQRTVEMLLHGILK